MTGHRSGAPPGERRGPASPPVPSNAEQLPRGSNVASLPLPPETASETVFVVAVVCGVLGWRRVFITAASAHAYAGRMQRRGHQVDVVAAVLVGGAM